MPTGYTEGVQTGKIQTLKEYALVCVRAMGVLHHMRDLPNGLEIPRKIEIDTYYKDRIEETQKEIDRLFKLSDIERKEKLKKLNSDKFNKQKKQNEDMQNIKNRYESMIEKIENWKIETDLISLKRFMLDQLHQSLEFDYYKALDNPVTEESRLSELNRDLAYYEREWEKQIQKNKLANQWLDKFFEAIDKL